MAELSTNSPNYSAALVEQLILEEAIELHPQRLTVGELSARIVADPEDWLEVETAGNAIQELRRSGLFRFRNDDEIVEPTHAAFRIYELLAGS
jgi:hypothetical protein